MCIILFSFVCTHREFELVVEQIELISNPVELSKLDLISGSKVQETFLFVPQVGFHVYTVVSSQSSAAAIVPSQDQEI